MPGLAAPEILARMQGVAAFGNFSWNAGPGGLWEF
jgi:hypothetical protein